MYIYIHITRGQIIYVDMIFLWYSPTKCCSHWGLSNPFVFWRFCWILFEGWCFHSLNSNDWICNDTTPIGHNERLWLANRWYRKKLLFFEMAAEDVRMSRFQISEGQVWIRCTGSIKKGAEVVRKVSACRGPAALWRSKKLQCLKTWPFGLVCGPSQKK